MKQSVFLTLLTPTLVFLNIISFCWLLILLFSSLKSLNLALFLFLPSKLNTPFWRTVLPFLAMLTDRFCFILTHLSTGFSFFTLVSSRAFPSLLHLCFPYFCSLPPLFWGNKVFSPAHLKEWFKSKDICHSVHSCQTAWCATEFRTQILLSTYIFEQAYSPPMKIQVILNIRLKHM